ncbi:hypothetical protein LCGC14_0845430 [marine sediment metagenome]|uniref:Uncharacterized protein n=1 Tax=marine sediment metagenome TaxID=412755 RepID=A0A0F9SJ28_9ZZZZ
MKVKIGHRYHLSATQSYLISAIKEGGAANVLNDFDGTDEEAIEAIRGDGLDHYPIGECDNRLENGRCNGHSK